MHRAWLPQMIQSRESFLSHITIATSHQDAMEGKLEPTRLTLMLQTEVFHLLNEVFNERWTRIKDTTIMSVVQLLLSELINDGTARLETHETGLQKLITERGGLRQLGVQGELAGLATMSVSALDDLWFTFSHRQNQVCHGFLCFQGRAMRPYVHELCN